MKSNDEADSIENNEPEINAGQNALLELGLDVSAISAHREDIKRKEFNRNVCVCGHAMNKHSDGLCHTARMYCPCENPMPVVEVSDTRYFMTKSRGYGAQHALSTGLSRLHEVGGSSRLIIEPKCFRCGEMANPLIPAGFSRDQWLVYRPGIFNGMFCLSCISEFPINHNS
jgi:hypothetical protein